MKLPMFTPAQISPRANAMLSRIGNTPLVSLYFESERLTVRAKAQFFNPSGGIKDRLAKTISSCGRHIEGVAGDCGRRSRRTPVLRERACGMLPVKRP